MRFYVTRANYWSKISKELLLLIGLSLLLIVTAGYVAAARPTASRSTAPAGPPGDSYAFLRPGNSLGPERANQTNYALHFDGADDFARVINTSSLTTTFTVEAWVKPDTVASDGQWEALFNGRADDDPSGGADSWVMYLPNSDHSRWGMSVCTPGCASIVGPSGNLVTGEWSHVAATYDGAIIKIYQDGSLVDSKAQSGNSSAVNYLFFGALTGTFNGLMDEIRVWDIVRTQGEIASTMIGSLQGDEAGLVGYWPLDDGAGQFASDASGNGQTARLGSADGVDGQDPAWVTSDSPLIPPLFQLIPLWGGLGTDIGIESFIIPGLNCGWSAGETVEVWWDKPEAKLATFTVEANGCFEGLLNLDDGERINGSEDGTHEVQARGSVSGIVTSPFEQLPSQLHLTPARGPAEHEVAISGCGWDGSSIVRVLWQKDNSPLARADVNPATGCIDDTLTIPRSKDGFYGLIAFTDEGLLSGAAYWVAPPTINLTPAEGPPGARVPLAGCNWLAEEQIDFAFTDNGQIFDTWGTSIGGCITSGGPTEPTLAIPITATLGAKTIRATGLDSGEMVDVPFTVITRTLAFDPDNGLPGDSIAASGCGWVGNDDVTLEWGYPDTNNLPIRWLANVDGSSGCFGATSDFFIDVPLNTINGGIVVTATGGTIGSTTATFTVLHPGTIELPLAFGYAGYTTTVDIVDAIIGETIFFKFDNNDVAFDGAGAATTDFSHEITLPDYASVGIHTVTAEGTKGFDDWDTVNILDNAQIAIVSSGDIYPGSTISVDGTDWSAGERISFELQKGGDSWPIAGVAVVPDGVLDFNVNLSLPSDLPAGQHTLTAVGNKGRDAETTLTIAAYPPPAFSLTAAFADPPPDLDGSLRSGEWDYGAKADFNNGFISARSDENRLYILLDLLGDTGQNSLGLDNFWLSFDLLNQRQIDPGWDLNFRLDGSGDLILEEYSGPDSFNPRNSVNLRSAYGSGFSCYFADGSLSLSFSGFFPRFSCSKHRVFEIGIDLATIDAEPGDLVRLGLRAISQSPPFSEDIPLDFTSDFSQLGIISLAPSRLDPHPPAGTVEGIGSKGFEVEVTQAIQDVNNDLHLVADKETVVRIYPEVADEALVRVFLFGKKDNQDLPGSPLVTLATIPAAIDRETLNNTANFLLPASWVSEGITAFTAIAENLDGSNVTAVQEAVVFHERRVPVIWTFPFNEGTVAAPIVPTQADMVDQERVLAGLLPTPSVTFVHRPWTDIGATGPISFSTMKKDLNSYWTMLSLANVLSRGRIEMPDLLYGFKVSRDPKAVGTSDPVYSGGKGRVVVGQADGRDFNSTTMIHEVNHDLDRSKTGTWGRHVANPANVKDRSWGCDAGGPDLSWPYTGNDSIQEVGFDAANPWDDGSGGHLTVLPTNRNDFMSYCWHKGTPIQWISPYRWQAMFAKFTPTSLDVAGPLLDVTNTTTETLASVYYISGGLNVTGTGSLDPIQVLPGLVSTAIVTGEYSIEVQNSNEDVLSTMSFTATFTDSEGVPLDTVYFNFQLPVQENVAKVLLKFNEQVLDSIVPSLNPPTATVTAPAGGESWSGQEIISWSANDDDGDDLHFTILYSPDEGNNYYPVATNLIGDEYTVDVGRLPGGEGGKIQLIVSDGFHTVQVQSAGVFTVPHPAPLVTINTPADGQAFFANQWIQLSGSANDLAGSAADTFTYTWTIEGQVVDVGSATNILLEEGDYTITLTAYDSLGNSGEATVIVTVAAVPGSNEVYLPVIVR